MCTLNTAIPLSPLEISKAKVAKKWNKILEMGEAHGSPATGSHGCWERSHCLQRFGLWWVFKLLQTAPCLGPHSHPVSVQWATKQKQGMKVGEKHPEVQGLRDWDGDRTQ